MPMKEIPHIQSSRPQSTFQRYMTTGAPNRSVGALQNVRTAALGGQPAGGGTTPAYLRQAVTPGPPSTSNDDLRALTEEYTRWADQMRRSGWTDAMLTQSPIFQNYQSRLVKLISTVNDPTILNSHIATQTQRAGAGDVYSPSATVIRDALTARQGQIAPAAPAGPTGPTVGTPNVDETGIYAGIHPEVMQQIIASAQAPAAPQREMTNSGGFQAPVDPTVPASGPQGAYTSPSPYTDPRDILAHTMNETGGGSAGSVALQPGTFDISHAQPMPLPTPIYETTQPVHERQPAIGDTSAVMPQGTPNDMRRPPPQSTTPPRPPRPQSPPNDMRRPPAPPEDMATTAAAATKRYQASMPSTNAQIGVSAPPAQPPATNTGPLSNVSSGTAKPSDSPYEMDEGTKNYMSRLNGGNYQ